MSEKANDKKLNILLDDPSLAPFEGDLNDRVKRFKDRKKQLLKPGQKLSDFANGHHFYGFHKVKGGWVYREWAPAAQALHLVGDFNGWNRESHPLKPIGDGNWEIEIPGVRTLAHESRVKVAVTHNGVTEDRIPLYANYVKQDKETHSFNACIWNPRKTFTWTDEKFSAKKNVPPIIYEAHVGMGTEAERVGTYEEFARDVLPRIKADGYNTVQLMAIMEHPYYASFGYQVANFFAASSWYGTPDDLKALINEAHRLGISVLLDIVHSHAVKNTAEGINCFDGTEYQFFHAGAQGDHPAWGSKCFDYGRTGVIHFLLSNVKYWMEEYHFDGFRFDGVTSMLYHDHGLGTAFTGPGQYFSMNTNVDAVTYLMMATEVAREVNKNVVLIAEDMSGMPGMCRSIKDGGIGFDYRLSMGLPDFFIKTIKEKQDGEWEISKMYWELICRRAYEKVIAYAESHDQALVGDKTMIFRLADAAMYTDMNKDCHNPVIDRAIALHKMIRLFTLAGGGEGYLNFMGNEFGHPEWIDFPREGNGWSFHYCRRQWSLKENGLLKYEWLNDFDRDMIAVTQENKIFNQRMADLMLMKGPEQTCAFYRGGLLFVFNFHPSGSLNNVLIPVQQPGEYTVILSSDDKKYGGFDNVKKQTYSTKIFDGKHYVELYIPARTAFVLKEKVILPKTPKKKSKK